MKIRVRKYFTAMTEDTRIRPAYSFRLGLHGRFNRSAFAYTRKPVLPQNGLPLLI
jgi:hypothetical protein